MAPPVARLLCLLAAAAVCTGFNLDTHHPVILQGPIASPGVERGESYFGYAVGLTTAPSTGPWVLVGAPRANSTLGLHDIRSTGAMYKCSLDQGRCEEVITDVTGDEVMRQPLNNYHDYKKGAWIGGAIDADPTGGEKVAVCGHRWINQYRPTKRYGNGVCYWMNSDVADYEATKTLPLINSALQTLDQEDRKSFLYAYGQAGISVHFAKNGSELLLGAPGIYNWKGSVVRLADTESFSPSPNVRRRRRRQVDDLPDLSVTRIPNAYRTVAVHENDYFGYSIGSGEFLGDGVTYYVAGAPRAALGNGKVFVFDFPPNELEGIGIVLERTGSQVGEYFGAAVLGLDVTGDGKPELLVGAPQHSLGAGHGAPTGLEEGRVCVYQNMGRGQLSDQPVVLTGARQTRARFGSSVANVGDLDMDGYNDIAVGAPYEDDQRGAVYIYLGGAGGITTSYSQRILASELSPLLRGFGVSISHGLDMDDNKYSDVAVGSYLSGEAVLLRAQPVLRFSAHLSPSMEKLRPSDRQFRVTACVKYFGQHLPDVMPTKVLMKIESRHVLCTFDLSGGSRDNFTYTRMLTYGADSCDTFTVQIKSDIHDYSQPIQLSMSYNISTDDGSVAAHSHAVEPVFISTDITKQAQRQRRRRRRRQASALISGDLSEFCASCPVVNRLDPGQSQVRTSVPFSIGCGEDAICQSNLIVAAAVRGLAAGEKFIVGASPNIQLDVNVTNTGEPASLPSVEVKLPQPLRLVRIPQLCTELEKSDHVLLTCHIRPHPFDTNAESQLNLAIDVKNLTPDMEGVTIQLNVSSAGEELMPDDNVYNFTLGLKAAADIAVTGQPMEEPPVYYDKKADRDESVRNFANYVILTHQYQVVRYLPSPVDAVNISFLVPVNVTDASGKEIRVVDVYRPKAFVEGRTLTCSIETGFFLAKDGNSYEVAPRTWRRNYQLTDEQRRLLAPPEYQFKGNVTTELNCTQPFVSCVRLECGTVAFPRPEINAVVRLSMRVKIHELEPYVGERDRLVISTVGLADVGAVSYPLQPADGRPDLYQVHSVLLPSSLQPFPVWIIVVTVIGALLLLAAITYGLYKAGFFKRRRPEGV